MHTPKAASEDCPPAVRIRAGWEPAVVSNEGLRERSFGHSLKEMARRTLKNDTMKAHEGPSSGISEARGKRLTTQQQSQTLAQWSSRGPS